MRVQFRPAADRDFDFCRRVYFAEMQWIIDELHLDHLAQEFGFHQQWEPSQIRIIAAGGADIGWLQTMVQKDELFVAQLFIERPFQRQGIGT